MQISEGREIDIRRAERQQVLRIARVRDEIERAIGWQCEDRGARWRTDQQVRKYIEKAEPDKPLSYVWIVMWRSERGLQPPEPHRGQTPDGGAEEQHDVDDRDIARARRDPAQKNVKRQAENDAIRPPDRGLPPAREQEQARYVEGGD